MNRLGDAPTDMLFGLIALHNDLVAPAVIPAALKAQELEPGRTLADTLVAQGALSAAQRDLVESLSGEYVKRHDGDAAKTLADLLETPSPRERLDRLADPDLTGSITEVAPWVRLSLPGTIRQPTISISHCSEGTAYPRTHSRGSPVTTSWRFWVWAGWASCTKRCNRGSTDSSL